VRRPVRILLGDPQVAPMTWGVLRHTILLPAAASGWSADRRRVVLAHELAHVKRADGLVQAFVHLVCAFHWFNPLVWYGAHRVRIEREKACDDHVLRLGAGAEDYADHLVQIVRGLRGYRVASYAALSMAQPSQLETRLVSILDSQTRRSGLSKPGAAALGALALAAAVSLSSIGVAGTVEPPPVFVAKAALAVAPAPAPAAVPGPAGAQRTRIGTGDSAPNNAVTPPQVLASRPPEYTQEALEANIEGVAVLEGRVSEDGKVSGLRVIQGLGHGLDQSAVEAVLGWTFGPALRNGAPVDAVARIEVDFKIPVWYKPLPKDENPPVRLGPGVTPPAVT
jgi:TonB family protein